MARYACRENDLGTANSWTALTTLGGETRNQIMVPPGCSRIVQIWTSVASSVFTDAKGCLFAYRLRGGAMGGVTYEGLAGGVTNGTITTSGAKGFYRKASVMDTSLAVESGAELWIDGCQTTGSDCGTPCMSVTLVFDGGGGEKRWSFVRVNEVVEAVDTRYACTLDPLGATVNAIQLPTNVSHITNLVTVWGGITLGATAGGGTGLIRLESACTEGEQVLGVGGWGSELTTTGLAAGVIVPDVIPTDIAVQGGSPMNVAAAVSGTDWGTVYIGVQVEVV